MNKRELQVGDVVQISPEYKGKAFAGCMAVVTEPKSFGFQGYVQGLGQNQDESGGQAYIRINWEDFEFVGRATWIAE